MKNKKTPLGDHATDTAKLWTHDGSESISSRIRILEFARGENARSVASLKVAIAQRNDERRLIESELAGLHSILEKR